MRIGIIVTSSFSAEIIKNEILRIGEAHRPWLQSTPTSLRFPYPDKNKTYKKQHEGVTSDAAIVSYLHWKYGKNNKEVVVEHIFPKELTVQRARKYDLVFMPMCDQLEVNTIFPRVEQQRYRRVLKTIPNLFPSYAVQKLINRKDLYYKYFTKRKLPMIDTLVVDHDTLKRQTIHHAVKAIRRYAKKKKWERIVVKPISGQEGLMFTALPEGVEDDKIANAIEDILKLYQGVLVQQYIPGFDKKMLESRVYMINNKYAYTILTNDSSQPKLLASEGGTVKSATTPWIRKLATKVARVMPKSVIHGISLPSWLLRCDIGYFPQTKRLFLSEVEFVPSLYAPDCPKGVYPEKLLGEGLIRITKQYLRAKNRRLSPSRRRKPTRPRRRETVCKKST